MIQIVSACRYLSTRKVMHRDLKPENIFYDPKSRIVKVLDFGSAVWYDSDEPARRRVVGTVIYRIFSHIMWHLRSWTKSITISAMFGHAVSFFIFCYLESPLSRGTTMRKF